MPEDKKRKIIIIGLDGANLDLIEPWAKEGFLPNFEKILNSGFYGRLRSVLPPYTAPAWTTLYTGKNLSFMPDIFWLPYKGRYSNRGGK